MINAFQTAYDKLLSLSNLQLRSYTDSKAELKRSLKRTEELAEMLGSPQNKLKIVHIGGTSGKGSVCAMMHQILYAHEKSVASYNSPHTTTFLERFTVNNKLIDPELLTTCMQDLLSTYDKFIAKGGKELSFFELSTILALYAFNKAGVKWCVLEVGCGGRFDATNIIQTPELAIITNIDKDHTQILGDSLSKIAFEKAGIIKSGGLVICGESRPTIRKIFKDEAVKKQAALFFVNPPNENIVDVSFGAHQQHNAALALRGALELGIDESAARQALKNVQKPPCRFETISKDPLIILDGAHSPAKIKASARLIASLGVPVHIVFGCTAEKEAEVMVKMLNTVAKTITTTRFSTTFRKASNPAQLLSFVNKSKRSGCFLDPQEALSHAREMAKPGEAVIVTGSLYLSGELRENWISKDYIIKHRSSF